MITLYISLYQVKDEQRKNEILSCLNANLINKQINKIVILNEDFEHDNLSSPKIEMIKITKRPFFSDFHSYLKNDSVNIIANNDIRFDNSLKKINYLF
jgi:hypothetical protein